MSSLLLNLHPLIDLTDEQFEQLAAANQELRLERTATGELIIMPPTGGETGERNLDLAGQLWLWNRQTNSGVVFDSSTGFRLPNGATRSPDVAWVELTRWQALTPQQRKKFPPLCPDFAIELCSETDDLPDIQNKMQEYLDNGLRLGWLIDPRTRRVEIYKLGRSVQILQAPLTLSEEAVLPGWVLSLEKIFRPELLS
jgi:Uma2 family endonuclease